ncbi:oxidoreductase [Kordiimonas sediminis]|uniref:Oxidoreductase n=1 Tax=Kordiimonas sediminis TaxID=1735581 RepID=A0A919E2Q8_9PROT|nr:SDR family NAD(P)-dependent oxidoreductase [Kordiimonas sediminis]GHF13516.1 oxidoreductase [Kordiimonas sediminis]
MRFTNRHVVITGGATGIGRAVAAAFLKEGAQVTIASRNEERLQDAKSALGGNVSTAVLDVTKEDDVTQVFADIGPVDILVNNAGAAGTAPLHKTSLDLWNQMLSVNLTGAFLCTRAVLDGMKKRNQGRIITIASTSGLKGYAYTAAYTASKHGVIGMTRSLALELANSAITANCVCPGFTDTEIVAEALDTIIQTTGRSRSDALAELVSHNPQKRLITPEEVASAVLWLSEDNNGSMNGHSMVVAGGEVM